MTSVATKLAKHHPNVDPYYWTKRPQELKDVKHPYTLTQAERDGGTIDPYKIVPGDGKPTRHQVERAQQMSKLQPGTISILPDGSFAHRGIPIDWKEWHGAEQYDWRKEFPEGLPEYIGPMHIKDVPPGYRSPTMIKELLRSQLPHRGPNLFDEPGGYGPSLFGKPPGANPDLFGKPYGVPPDLFGKPYGVEPDLFGKPPHEPITLFGKPTTIQPDLFGQPSTLQPRLSFEDPLI